MNCNCKDGLCQSCLCTIAVHISQEDQRLPSQLQDAPSKAVSQRRSSHHCPDILCVCVCKKGGGGEITYVYACVHSRSCLCCVLQPLLLMSR